MVDLSKAGDIRVATTTDRLHEVREMAEDLCREAGMDERVRKLVVVAIDEAVTNIVNHAQAIEHHGDVRIQIDINEVRFRALIEDFTNGTSVSTETEEETASYLKESKRHKLGIFLMQRILDEINYTFKKGFQNDLELIYFFDDEQP